MVYLCVLGIHVYPAAKVSKKYPTPLMDVTDLLTHIGLLEMHTRYSHTYYTRLVTHTNTPYRLPMNSLPFFPSFIFMYNGNNMLISNEI